MDLKTAAKEAITAFETFDCADANERTECRRIAGLLRDALASSAASQGEPVAEVVSDAYQDHEARIEALAFLPAGTKLYAALTPSASERQQGGECSVCDGRGYFQEPDSEVGHVARECESCAPAPAATRAGEAEELVKRLKFLRIVTDEFTLKEIKVLAEAVFAAQPPQAPPAAPSALKWSITSGGALSAGPYSVVERIDARGWNASFLDETGGRAGLDGVPLEQAKNWCEAHSHHTAPSAEQGDVREYCEAQAGGTEGDAVAWIDQETFDCLTKNPHGALAYHRWLSVGAADHFQGRTIPIYARAALAAAPAAAQGDVREQFDAACKAHDWHGTHEALEAWEIAFEQGRQQGMSQANALWEMAKAEQAVPAGKVLDDPRLQELFSSTIDGALTSGYQGVAPAPAGHWLERWWKRGEAVRQREETLSATPATERRPLIEAEVEALLKDWFEASGHHIEWAGPHYLNDLRQLIRAAHGIGITAGTTEQAKEQKDA